MGERFFLKEIKKFIRDRTRFFLCFAPDIVTRGEVRVGALQAGKAHPFTARHQFVCKRNWIEIQIIFDIFQPGETAHGGCLQTINHGFADSLKLRESRLYRAAASKGIRQRNRIFHR